MVVVTGPNGGKVHRPRGYTPYVESVRCRCGVTVDDPQGSDSDAEPVHPSTLCRRCFPPGGPSWSLAVKAWRRRQQADEKEDR